MTQSEIFEKVSEDLKLSASLISLTYKGYWLFIRSSILELPLKENLTEEQFNSLKTSFNIPSIGKLHCTYDRYIGMKKRFNYIKTLQND